MKGFVVGGTLVAISSVALCIGLTADASAQDQAPQRVQAGKVKVRPQALAGLLQRYDLLREQWLGNPLVKESKAALAALRFLMPKRLSSALEERRGDGLVKAARLLGR